MTAYEQAGYNYAVANAMTPQQILAATYRQVATACGVTLGPDGSSPPDFHYEKIRIAVAAAIWAAERQGEFDTRRQQILTKMKELAEWADLKVTPVEAGSSYTAPVDGWFVRRT